MVFRYLRMLEGVSPPLSLTHTACQASAKAFISTRMFHHILWHDVEYCSYNSVVFDRMFSLGIRGGAVDTTPVGGRVAVATAAGAVSGPRRHFLYCSLKPDASSTSRKSRE
jgi:hypothetical protein